MHVKKNVSDSLIGTLLNIKRNTKHGLKCHQDLVNMGIQEKLHPQSQGHRMYLPPACHTMSTKEEISFLSLSQKSDSPIRILFKYQKPCVSE